MSNLPRTIVEAGAWLRDGRITCTELLALYPYLCERSAGLRVPEVRYGEPVLNYSALPHQ